MLLHLPILLLHLLTLLFIGLNLAGFIAWSLWWVISPSIVALLFVAVATGLFLWADKDANPFR